ncbi:MarR family transcriptional regulator [Mycolicibacterium murale]|jgi:DNA-binding MarR family transcriptional regulator|uniref:MarR family transcriptional regulator n=1 Tax=Mycolicibacterium murale TaxID=182220 RepID=A0A7I9WWC9_9MYCO|nr:MarR family transcriptional regulator [Mycolicibacterium murale]ANW62928.1 MarR family transcriptional regulator [Mycobacterium sp. djl-10]MCV7181034.1 MarR family transcriptional regulator [Mycolicibacterium murale]GFG62005.1 MarR family transcriptional regulator [Mycolicibacterium murale]
MARSEEPTWLTPQEKEAWTGLAALMLMLPGRLDSALREVDLTLFEYLVLSHVSEAPDRRIRMSELAFLANGSLSRLSNVVKRFEQRGWMTRSPDPDDGRYTLAHLTDDGFRLVVEAAPVHMRSLRQLVLDPLTPTDLRALTRIADKLRVVHPNFGAQQSPTG